MLMVIDTGNTTTAAGVYDGEELIAHWRLSSTLRTSDEFGMDFISLLGTKGLKPSDITGVALASVVPSLDFPMTEAIKQYFGVTPLQVNGSTDTGMKILTDNPREVGADRIVNALAGREKYGMPLIVADYGTAITFDVVSPEGSYMGGAIAPGLTSSISALFSKAAKLPQVALNIPRSVIGGNTEQAIQSGILFGNAGLTDRIVDMIRSEPGMENAKVIATGGHAGLMAKVSERIDIVDKWLTLEGLKMIYERVNE
ncbi:MAG: type III pantothenate kinase [Synergistaceae bacterium]|nr:type III pantothenate kinase [Synergistaceae bacterium]MBQ3347610.1 type III pantothenate kinase [Synergistaceae bacterium]MBQ3398627.1 type III pantothenate kinase [Synergistaceae bacterium]MBQ4400548.1 type III pantothenate kinase [Synergistaceae bacterium]MBQ6114598.1 type III pantothenate kinase [Synergistaceae bacterium]